eukprot:2703179-Rhodomonas_salina.2
MRYFGTGHLVGSAWAGTWRALPSETISEWISWLILLTCPPRSVPDIAQQDSSEFEILHVSTGHSPTSVPNTQHRLPDTR